MSDTEGFSGLEDVVELPAEGTPTACPPTSDTEVVLSPAADVDYSWSPLSGDETLSSAPSTEIVCPARGEASSAASTDSLDSDLMECPACHHFVVSEPLCPWCLSPMDF